MDPWKLVGWIVAIFLTIAFAPTVLRLAYGFLIALPVALVKDCWANWTRYRADKGWLGCQDHRSCHRVATRRTPNGYFCDEHALDRRNRGSGIVSYAFFLKHAQPVQEDK